MKSYEDRDSDALEKGPPTPRLRDAKSADSRGSSVPSSMPRSSGNSSAAAMAMMGASPVREVTEAMATIEQMIKQMAKHVPAIVQVAQPFVQQMRDMGMAGLANLSQGGAGSVDMGGAGATPPPGMAPPGAPPGAAGTGSPIMPMPPM